jgi:hypothetical protein
MSAIMKRIERRFEYYMLLITFAEKRNISFKHLSKLSPPQKAGLLKSIEGGGLHPPYLRTAFIPAMNGGYSEKVP